MKSSSLFDLIAAKLEESTSFNRLEARGTLRIMLKESGLDIKTLQSDQMKVTVDRVLPQHLRDRGIDDPERVCRLLLSTIPRDSDRDRVESPEAIFERLGSR